MPHAARTPCSETNHGRQGEVARACCGGCGADSPTTVRRERLRQNRVFCPAFVGQVRVRIHGYSFWREELPSTSTTNSPCFGCSATMSARPNSGCVPMVTPMPSSTASATRVRPGLFGFVLATLHSVHCVDIYANAPALAWWKAVRDKPLLHFKLTQEGTWFRGITNKLSRAVFGVGWSALLAATQMRPYLIFDSIDGCLNFLVEFVFSSPLDAWASLLIFYRNLYRF